MWHFPGDKKMTSPPPPRQRRILDAVRQQVTVSLELLAQQLDVTQTVRRDVKLMEEAGMLARYHGGVGLPSSVENIDYSRTAVSFHPMSACQLSCTPRIICRSRFPLWKHLVIHNSSSHHQALKISIYIQ